MSQRCHGVGRRAGDGAAGGRIAGVQRVVPRTAAAIDTPGSGNHWREIVIKLPHLFMKPPELPPGFGLRWQAKRDTALVEGVPNIRRPAEPESAVAAALCRRSPNRQ